MSSFFSRLQDAAQNRERGDPKRCTVQRADLRELLHHFERLDNAERARYEQQINSSSFHNITQERQS
jgi:hypothetical protein